MRISLNQTHSDKVANTNGYGYAAEQCKVALDRLGHEVSWRDPDADIEMNFIQPENWYWSGAQYRIAYLPWESTALRPGWAKMLNECDEVWTPSPVIAQWFKDEGVTKDVHVYEHGVDSATWAPVKRNQDDTYRVLHHGAEALRKGGNEVISGFLGTLGDEDARLVLKMINPYWQVHDTKHIEIHKTKTDISSLVELCHGCHLFCYPSWGEGFGLTPLQAMATGMPVLITDGWAPYAHLLTEKNFIKSTLVDSPWQDFHPGKMFQPDADDLQDKIRWFFDNRASAAEEAGNLVKRVVEEYDWTNLTRNAFSHLFN
jgi:glycosyltransferase involved in cell wall biosynthesis